MMQFITNLAWVGVVLSVLLIIIRIYGAHNYTELDEMMDKWNGIKRSWPIEVPLVVCIVCGIWVFTFH